MIEPVSIAEEFVHSKLAASSGVTAAFGTDIYPAFAPDGVNGPHITHDFAGPTGDTVRSIGGPVAGWHLLWDVIAWNNSQSRYALRAGMVAAMAALAGTDLAGIVAERFVSADGTGVDMECEYLGPVPVPADVGPAGLWQRVAARFDLYLRAA